MSLCINSNWYWSWSCCCQWLTSRASHSSIPLLGGLKVPLVCACAASSSHGVKQDILEKSFLLPSPDNQNKTWPLRNGWLGGRVFNAQAWRGFCCFFKISPSWISSVAPRWARKGLIMRGCLPHHLLWNDRCLKWLRLQSPTGQIVIL